MFILEERPTFRWPVRFTVPVDGRQEEREITVEFHRLDSDEFTAAFTAPADGSGLTDRLLCDRICTGWYGAVKLPDGTDMPVTPEGWARLLGLRGMPSAVVQAYLEAERLAPLGN